MARPVSIVKLLADPSSGYERLPRSCINTIWMRNLGALRPVKRG